MVGSQVQCKSSCRRMWNEKLSTRQYSDKYRTENKEHTWALVNLLSQIGRVAGIAQCTNGCRNR